MKRGLFDVELLLRAASDVEGLYCWERQETGFVEAAYAQIADQVGAVRQQNSAVSGRPWWKFWQRRRV